MSISLTNNFLIFIQSGLGFLFFYPNLMGGLTFFKEEQKEQEGEKKHIYHSQRHFYSCLSFDLLHCHTDQNTSVFSVTFFHSYYHHNVCT